MGLDMYLEKRKYVNNWRKDGSKIEVTLIDDNGEKHVSTETYNNVKYLTFGAIYWRKANAIHKWFIDNCCEGVDDQLSHYVSKDKLIELKETCQKVLDNHELAEELLPTQEGFFFGTYDYDEYYYDDLKYTIESIDKVLETFDDTCDKLFYKSWW